VTEGRKERRTGGRKEGSKATEGRKEDKRDEKKEVKK
jgi:hypothetical protein